MSVTLSDLDRGDAFRWEGGRPMPEGRYRLLRYEIRTDMMWVVPDPQVDDTVYALDPETRVEVDE